MLAKILNWFKLEVDWLSDVANRKKVYKFLKALGPVLILGGFFTPDEITHYLEIAAGVLLLGSNTIADRHAK